MRDYIPQAKEPYNFEDKIKIDDILEKTIVIHRFFIQHKNFQGNEYDAVTFEFSHDGNENKFTSQTSSGVLLTQFIREEKEGLPFRTRIVKIKNYYTMSEP